MNINNKQREYLVDVFKAIGITSFLGSAAEAALHGAGPDNVVGVVVGLITLWIGFRLTKKLNGDKV